MPDDPRAAPAAGRQTLLRETGAALYGPLNWKAPLARDLGVSAKTIQRWDNGSDAVPPGVLADLLRITQQRAMELDALGDRLRRYAAP